MWHCVDMDTKDIWTEQRPPAHGRSPRAQGDVAFHDMERAVGNTQDGLWLPPTFPDLTLGSGTSYRLSCRTSVGPPITAGFTQLQLEVTKSGP